MCGGSAYLSLSGLSPQDPSGKVDPTSSYATAGMALKDLDARKPPHPVIYTFVKVEIPSLQKIVIKGKSAEMATAVK
jgi:hypothetical protein